MGFKQAEATQTNNGFFQTSEFPHTSALPLVQHLGLSTPAFSAKYSKSWAQAHPYSTSCFAYHADRWSTACKIQILTLQAFAPRTADLQAWMSSPASASWCSPSKRLQRCSSIWFQVRFGRPRGDRILCGGQRRICKGKSGKRTGVR